MRTCLLIISSICLKETPGKKKSMNFLKQNKYKLLIESEMLQIKREKKFKQLIKSEMVPLQLYRNGEQNKRYETKLIELEERRT